MLKYDIFLRKPYFFLSFVASVAVMIKKEESKKEDSIDILKTLAFIKNMKEYQRNTKLFSRQIWLKKRKVNNFDSKI